MLRRSWLWILGTISLIGVSIAGYAYATSCGFDLDTYDMRLISVTYDGVPQSNPPDYESVTGVLSMNYGRTSFRIWIEKQPSREVLEYGDYVLK